MSKVLIDTPSGTPAMPIKAYYHEWTDLEGVRTRSVGLEVRKEFSDAPLVLESDALARIARLEGEIAKRDEELAACRVAVENCEVFRARIAEIEADRDSHQRCAIQAMAELAAIKAQEPVAWAAQNVGNGKYGYIWHEESDVRGWINLQHQSCNSTWHGPIALYTALYAAPVSEAKAQAVVMQSTDGGRNPRYEGLFDGETEEQRASRLNATPVQQVSVPDGYAIVPIVPTPEMIKAALDKPCFDPLGDPLPWSHITRTSYAAMLAAAPAAPAADAGIVDMYRHLQKVTPYRFKKIQDASITDGGDVMYFHKDRFDAALLADMAAHCAAKGVV